MSLGLFQTDLDLRSVNGLYKDYFIQAGKRWDSIIVGDLEDFPVDPGLLQFSDCRLRHKGTIDDIHICVIQSKLDGTGGVIGSGSAEYSRLIGETSYPLIGSLV